MIVHCWQGGSGQEKKGECNGNGRGVALEVSGVDWGWWGGRGGVDTSRLVACGTLCSFF